MDVLSRLLDRNIYYAVLTVFIHLDFQSLRRTLWVCQTWRHFTFSNLQKLKFHRKEAEHNLKEGFSLFQQNFVTVKEKSHDLDRVLRILVRESHSLEDLLPLRIPVPLQSDCMELRILFNKDYFLVPCWEDFTRVTRLTGDVLKWPRPSWFRETKPRKDVNYYFSPNHLMQTRFHGNCLSQHIEGREKIFKMSQDATQLIITHEVPYDKGFKSSFPLWGFSPDGTKLRCDVVFYAGRVVVHCSNLIRPELLWSTEVDQNQEHYDYVQEGVFGERFLTFVLYVYDSSQAALYVFDITTGELKMKEYLDFGDVWCISEGDDIRVAHCGNKIVALQTLENKFPREWDFFMFDTTVKTQTKTKCNLSLPENEEYLGEIADLILLTERHLAACLVRHRGRCTEVFFVIWDLAEKDFPMMRRIHYENMDYLERLGPSNEEVWVLKERLPSDADVEDFETKIVVFSYNKSLKLMETFKQSS